MQLLTESSAVFVGHHREREAHVPDIVEQGHCGLDPAVDLVAHRAARDRERNRDVDPAALDRDIAHHVELDDAAVELRILDGPQRVDDSVGRQGHARAPRKAYREG